MHSYASNELKNDRTLVLQAVRRNGRSLQKASAALKGDREIVMEAVKEDGARFSLRQNCREIVD